MTKEKLFEKLKNIWKENRKGYFITSILATIGGFFILMIRDSISFFENINLIILVFPLFAFGFLFIAMFLLGLFLYPNPTN